MAYVGGKRPKAKLKFDKVYYTPIGAKELGRDPNTGEVDKSVIRKEYSRLRSIARKRIERLSKSEWNDSQIYLQNKDGFKTLKNIKSDRELRHEFSQLARFVTSDRGSASGQNKIRKNTVETLRDRGYDFVTVKNFREFGEFMEYARMATANRLYDSERVANVYESLERRGADPQTMKMAYNAWRKNQKKKAKVQNKQKRDSEQYRTALE